MNLKIYFLSSVLFTAVPAMSQQKLDSGFIKHSSTMAERWELGDENHKGLFLIIPYKPVYVTAGRWSNNPNTKPTSENPLYTLPFRVRYNNYEAKFQFSLKTKIARKLFWGHGDLWVAYTQKAHWQVYNKFLSRPFRELNYEPEIILNFATNYKVGGLKGSMLGFQLPTKATAVRYHFQEAGTVSFFMQGLKISTGKLCCGHGYG